MGWRERLAGKKKRLLLVAGVVMVALGVGSVELTSQSWFCNSCHIMNPYYSSWQHGAHKEVECVKCHISPGVDNFLSAKLNGLGQVVDDVLHRTSTKPSASVSQLACSRPGCHSLEKVKATEKTKGKFLFKHDKHLGLEYKGIALACGTCHSHVKGDNHFQVNTEVCVTCHLIERSTDAAPSSVAGAAAVIQLAAINGSSAPTLASDAPTPAPAPATPVAKLAPTACITCHQAPTQVLERNGLKIDHGEFIAYGASCESCHRNVTLTPPPIEDGRCLECHTFGVEKTLGMEEMHKVHGEGRHKIECFSCHGDVKHGLSAQAGSLAQFDCRQCHKDQHAIQRNTYLSASGAAPHSDASVAVSPMFLAHVSCTGCHVKDRSVSTKPESGATVAAAVPESCDRCHKPGLGKQMIPLWQRTTHSLFDQLTAEVASAKDAGADAELLASARRVLETIRVDGSWGVHNPKYTQQLLEDARQKLAAAKKGGAQ